MTNVMFVSVNHSFDSDMSLAALEPYVERAWGIPLASASTADRVVATYFGKPVAAWAVRGAFVTNLTYGPHNKPRIGLSLGAPLPVLPEYAETPILRRGAAVVDLDVPALPVARPELVDEPVEID